MVFVGLLRTFARVMLRKEWQLLRHRIDVEWANLASHPAYSPPIIAQLILISGEDHRHGQHNGYDIRAICRAAWKRIAYGTCEGASTIEQQIVRVLTNRYEKTLARKAREILLATLVTDTYPKAILPPVYLKIGYYGWRMNGYVQACQRLATDPVSLSLDEAAGVVARLKYPQPRVAPANRIGQIQRRKQHLLRLYHRHIFDGTYEHIIGSTIQSRSTAREFARSLP